MHKYIYTLLLDVLIILVISSIYYLVGRYANRVGEEARDLQSAFLKFINDLLGGFKELSLNKNKKHEFQGDMENTCDNYRVKRGKRAIAITHDDQYFNLADKFIKMNMGIEMSLINSKLALK